jgi:hypothetical protein
MGGFAFDRGLLTIFERGEPVAGGVIVSLFRVDVLDRAGS